LQKQLQSKAEQRREDNEWLFILTGKNECAGEKAYSLAEWEFSLIECWRFVGADFFLWGAHGLVVRRRVV
jgi:hypothetical protein